MEAYMSPCLTKLSNDKLERDIDIKTKNMK